MDTEQARLALESLRKGIPPEGMIRHFTVGETAELLKLIKTKNILEALQERSKDDREDGAIFIKPSDGSGKTHYLKLIEEEALAQGFAVSLVFLDNKSGVRFDRMDQIMGAVLRNLRIPTEPCIKGVRPFFRLISDKTKHWEKGAWDSDAKADPDPFHCALRAWLTGRPGTQNLVEDWLYSPWLYRNQKRKLYKELILKLQAHFIDKRPKEKFLSGDVLSFHAQEYELSWNALMQVNLYALISGSKGLVMLFDNLRDLLSLRGLRAYGNALHNVHKLAWSGFWGLSCFSLDHNLHWRQMVWGKNDDKLLYSINYDFHWLTTKATSIKIEPLDESSLIKLFRKIVITHGIAYDWSPINFIDEDVMENILHQAIRMPTSNKPRSAIIQCVNYLDRELQETQL